MLVTSSSQNFDILNTNTAPVVSGDEAVSIILALESEMANLSSCVGLAAPQIGISKSVSIIRYEGVSLNLINPTLISGERSFINKREGCMSFPDRRFNIPRFSTIRVRSDILWPSPSGTVGFGEDPNKMILDKNNPPKGLYLVPSEAVYVLENFTKDYGNTICIAVQHEIDHLLGRTLDNLPESKEVLTSASDPKWNVGRNDPCPCGKTGLDGKPVKFKKCCLQKMT